MLIIIEEFLDAKEIEDFRNRLADAPWLDGRKTAGGIASRFKINHQVDDQSDIAINLANRLLEKLGNHPTFVSSVVPQRIHPPRFNRYGVGETYGVHVDAPIMSLPNSNEVFRSDVSATLFLSEPQDYDGGELIIEGEFGSQSVKLNAGDMVVYPSSSLHQVTPITRGERISAILWAQSMVADASARGILFDLDTAIQSLSQLENIETDKLMSLTHIYHNLVRRWVRI